MIPTLQFGDQLSLDRFLSEYWQKRPLLLRNAIDPSWLAFPADELAGLACEPEVESRLIRQLGDTEWSLQHGPLDSSVFAALPESDWTLLVQDVDKHISEVARVLDAFAFLPDWRLDDIMISFATHNGGVGPHTDNYDVFLIQAQGQRRWRLSDREYGDRDLLQDCPLRVLRSFEVTEDWLLEPGDVLYLPPRLAHWGTAVDDCMTWSIGLRGPSQAELLDAWLQYRSGNASPLHLRDSLSSQRYPTATITEREFAQAHDLMTAALPAPDDAFRVWFGCFVTEPKADFEIAPSSAQLTAGDLRDHVAMGNHLHRHPWARFAHLRLSDDSLGLCAQGEFFPTSQAHQAALEMICERRLLESNDLLALPQHTGLWAWLSQLFNRGLLITDD